MKIAEIDFSSKSRKIIGLYEVTPRPEQTQADALREFFGQSQIRAERVGIGLNDTNTLLKRFEFPFRDRKRVKLAVEGEWMDIVPFELSDYALDTRPATKQGRLYGFLSGICPTSRIEALNLICESAWVQPNAVLVDAEALGLLALSQNLPGAAEAQCYAVCDFGYELTKLALLRGTHSTDSKTSGAGTSGTEPEIIELRHIDKGSREWIQWIADKRKVNTEEALQWLMHRAEIQTEEHGEESIRDDLSDDIKSALRPVVVELYQTLQSSKVRTGLNPEILYITGSMCRIQGLQDFLEHELRLKVVVWPLFHAFEAHEAVSSPSNQKSFATALALANAFTLRNRQPWLNFKRTTSPNKRFLSEAYQQLIGPELKPAFALMGVALAFVWAYSALGGYLTSIQRTAVEKDLAGEFRRLDNGMGERANRLVSDPDRAREIFEELRKKKTPRSRPENDLGPGPQVAILEDFSMAAPPQVKVSHLEVQYGGRSTQLQAHLAPVKPADAAQLPQWAEQLVSALTRAGYSEIQQSPQGSGETMRISAKLLPKAKEGAAR